MHFCVRCSMLSYTRCNSAVSILLSIYKSYMNTSFKIPILFHVSLSLPVTLCRIVQPENSKFKILRIDTAELQRVYYNMLQRAQKCIDVLGDHFQHLL